MPCLRLATARAFYTPSIRHVFPTAYIPMKRLSTDTTESPLEQPDRNREKLSIETFGNLAPWSQRLENDILIEIRIRHHEQRPIKVQAALLHQVCNLNTVTPPTIEHLTTHSTPILDLTTFEPTASMTFLFWLFNRRLPLLRRDYELRSPATPQPLSALLPATLPPRLSDSQTTLRAKKEAYNIGLIEAWRLGAALACPRFQNDILARLALLLDLEETHAERSATPHYSSAIAWARSAYDATLTDAHAKLRDFAVDVAARRVFDVGASGLTLSRREREDLSRGNAFAGEVFASLGGQIGNHGVEIQDLVRQYLEEDGDGKGHPVRDLEQEG